jgi:hypothetical protein
MPAMRFSTLLLAAILAATVLPIRQASALDSPRPLSGRELQVLLLGNTLIGADQDGPFWMYYPNAATLWGRSASGDVDVGEWWIENDSYCRAWRRWFEGRTRCWQMMAEGDVLLWYSLDGESEGRSVLRDGNAMGDLPQMDAAPPQLADLGTGLSSELEAVVARASVPPDEQIGPRGTTSSDREGSGGDPLGRSHRSENPNPQRPRPLAAAADEDLDEGAGSPGAAPSSAPGGLAGLAGTRLGGVLDRLGIGTGAASAGGATTGGSGGSDGGGSDGGGGGSGGGERSR